MEIIKTKNAHIFIKNNRVNSKEDDAATSNTFYLLELCDYIYNDKVARYEHILVIGVNSVYSRVI